MYGLEKNPREKFHFDIEVELKDNPQKTKKLFEKIEKNIHELKDKIRKGGKPKDLDDLGLLLHGYTALQKVLKKSQKS